MIRAGLLLFCVSGALLPLLAADSPETAKDRIALPIGLLAYLTADETVPAVSSPVGSKSTLPPFMTETRLYDPSGETVKSPTKPGPYFLELSLRFESEPAVARRLTLFRLAKPSPGLGPLTDETRAKWAEASGIPLKELQREREAVAAVLGRQDLAAAMANPRAARLFAGLSLMPERDTPASLQDGPMSWERQGWLDILRKRDGLKPVDAKTLEPRRIDPPAPVVREGTPAEAGVDPQAVERLDTVLADWAADDDQAFAVCIVRKGVIVLHKAYGTRDGRPMTLKTKSWMASITKPMAASCLMMLADHGLVKLDGPLEDHLPSLKGLRKEPVRVRQLLNHTAGLSSWPADLYRDEHSDLVDRLALAYPHLESGKAFGYNGQGYAAAGKVMERVTGLCMPRYYQRCLLGPLGMADTDVIGTHADARSVPLDIAKFGQMLLNGGRYGHHEFFGPAMFKRMLPTKLTDDLGPMTDKVFGLGLDGNPRVFGHGAASAATFRIDRDRELVVVMCRDKQGKNQGKYGGKFHEALEACLKPAR